MILLLHIIIALTSVLYTLALYHKPTSIRLKVSCSLLFVTVASGVYLIVAKPGHMLETCTVGLLYTTIVTTGIVASRRKLALYSAKNK